MQYQVFVQHPSEQHFIASVISMPGVTAEGQTREEAIARAKAMLEERLAMGEFVTIDVELPQLKANNTWIKYQGIFADDPTFDDFLAEIAAYRY